MSSFKMGILASLGGPHTRLGTVYLSTTMVLEVGMVGMVGMVGNVGMVVNHIGPSKNNMFPIYYV